MSTRLRIRVGAGLAAAAAALAATVAAGPAAGDRPAPRATVVILQPGAAGATTRADVRALLTARAQHGIVTVLVTSRPATVLVPPTRSQAALGDALAAPLPSMHRLSADAGARAVLALATRLGSPSPSVVFTGRGDGGAQLAAATARQARVAGVALGLDDLATALRRERVGAAAPRDTVPVRRAAAVTAQAVPPTAFPTALVALAAVFALAAGGLVVRSRPVAVGVVAGRIQEWTRPADHVANTDDDTADDVLVAEDGSGLLGRVQDALDLTDMRLDARALVARTGVATVVLAVLAFLVFPLTALVVLPGVPLLVRSRVRKRIRKRRLQFADQLGDTVSAIASAMRAGHGISSSLAMLVDDLPEPTQSEMRAVVSAERIGVPFDQALEDAVRRTASKDLEQVALVASLQRETGGNGAEALDRVVDTIRARDDVRRLITTLTAQGRMSRWVLTALPVALGLVLLVIGHGYLAPLAQTAVGRSITVFALLLVTAGSSWIGRIVEIDV